MNAAAMMYSDLPNETPAPATDAAFMYMHGRLVTWGLIMLKGAGAVSEEEEAQARSRVWTGRQQEAAMNLHRRVIRLPRPEHRIVLQVFYALNVASRWYEEDIVPLWNKIERQHTPEVNARLRVLARETYTDAVTIQPWQFRAVKDRAIRLLVNGERLLPSTS